MDKKQSEARRRQEDTALNHGLIWVGAAIVLEALLMLVNRYYINFRISDQGVALAELISGLMKYIRIGGPILGILCLVWAVLRFRKGEKAGLPTTLALACGALAICAHVAKTYQENGMRMLFFLVPAWAGLALVYYLYQKEFFLAASASGMSVLGLWFVRATGGLGLESALMLVGIVIIAAIALWLKKSGGVLHKADGSEVSVLPKNASYLLIFASCVVGLAVVAAALALGATVSYYLIFAMVAWLFVLLVYYTVKLM